MQLLLPYAHDNCGNVVHINDAQKGQKYTCPICEAELLLRISKIPEGQKYHKRNHYAHKSNTDNHCSESFLHKRFKEKCAEFIQNKIDRREKLFFVYECNKCHKGKKEQKENILKDNIVDVRVEYNLGVCKPDIALLDNNKEVIFVIEIVVTHKPRPISLDYYEEQKITCLQIKISDFDDCEHIEQIFTNPQKTTILFARKGQTIQSSNGAANKFIECLLTKGSKICPECGGDMQIKKTIFEEHFLECMNAPNCKYQQKIDCLIWPDKFSN